MRAHTITTMSRLRRRRRALALVLGLSALVIPSTASAGFDNPQTSGYSTPNATTGGTNESSQPACYSDSACSAPTTVNALTAGSPGSADVDPGYSSLNAVAGPPADSPTLVSGSPSGSGEGFDWPSAAVGAGAALALAALGGAALLTVRRRTVTPSPSTS
jgi:hypothetical protein